MNLPNILLGTFQCKQYEGLKNVVDAAMQVGIRGFDTAPSYGTEKKLGKAINECSTKYKIKREDLFISDKIDAWQMQEGNGNISKYVKSALHMMKLDFLDLLLIHWPIADYLENTWNSFNDMQKQGLVQHIGICNVRVRHLEQMKLVGIEPECIQIERHPLRICDKEMDYCHKHGISVLSYSPLCRMHSDLCNSLVLNELTDKYNKNIGQIILRWQLDTNAVPVFMSKNPIRIKDNIDIFDFSLTKEEIEKINLLNTNYKIFLESWGCPGF